MRSTIRREAPTDVMMSFMSVDRIFEEIIGLSGRSAMVMGIGNIGGQGMELVHYFHNRSAWE